MRSGRINMFAVLLVLAIAAGCMLVERFGPCYWDYWKMKEVAKTAALHWKMFGKKAGEEKLVGMLDAKDISDYIEPSYCELVNRGEEKSV